MFNDEAADSSNSLEEPDKSVSDSMSVKICGFFQSCKANIVSQMMLAVSYFDTHKDAIRPVLTIMENLNGGKQNGNGNHSELCVS